MKHTRSLMAALCGLCYRNTQMILLGILFTWLLPHLTGSENISLHPKDNITISIKQGSNGFSSQSCKICTPKDGCKLTALYITPGMNVTYSFSCSTPEKYFIMQINKMIDCNSGLCPYGNVDLQPANLRGLNRTFSWNVSAAQNIGLELNFSAPWLRQIDPSFKCPDLVTYQISTSLGGSPINIGTFCRKGSVSRIKVQGGGVVVLDVPWNETFTQSGFSIANRSSIRRLCIIESTFQSESFVTLMSANYPVGFPDDELMTWQFIIPPNHRASIQFLNYTLPNCEKKDERVEYYLPVAINNPEVLKLTDNQPANINGNFNLSLQNCDLDNQRPDALTLLFGVTVQQTPDQGNIVYHVDLTKEKNMVVHIRRKPVTARRFVPVCKICKGPTDCDTELSLVGGRYYKISFLCEKLYDSMMMTAEKEIACWDLTTCNKNVSLTIPRSLIELPVHLVNITWKLLAPANISTEIVSNSMKLQQDITEKPCTDSTSDFCYDIVSFCSEIQFNIGTFSPNGSIEKIQLRDNVTITLRTRSRNSSSLLNHDLRVSFVSFIKEECIFTVTPARDSTVYLQTPNWDKGLPDYVSVSWGIAMPTKQFARLTFAKDKMDIVCEQGRAYIYINEQKSSGTKMVRREDESLPITSELYSSFWLNISNCKPKTKSNKLQMRFSVSYSQSNSGLEIIIIAAAASVTAILLVIGVTVCCIRKKKKKEKRVPVGIYNSRANTEMPRRQAFLKKGRKKNESHVYAVIDDTVVYGHLLKDPNGSVSPDVDVYRPFEGAMGDVPPVPPLHFLNGSTKDENREEDPLALSMKSNELYTLSVIIPKEPVENEDTSLNFVDEQDNGTVPTA